MKLSLTRLLILTMVLITFLMTVGVVYVSFDHYAFLMGVNRQQNLEVLNTSMQRLSQAMRSLEDMITTLSNLDAVRKFSATTSRTKQYEALELVRSLLDNTVYFSDSVEMALLVLPENRIIRSSQNSLDIQTYKTLMAMLSQYPLNRPFNATIATPVIDSDDQLDGCFALISPVFSGGYQGCAVLICSAKRIAEPVLAGDTPYLLMHENTRVLINAEDRFSEIARWESGIPKAKESCALLDLSNGPWTLYTGHRIDAPLHLFVAALQDSVMVLILILLAQLLLGVLLYRIFLVPFMDISHQVAAISSPAEELHQSGPVVNELVTLTDNLNNMLVRINQLSFRAVRTDELLLRESNSRLKEHNLFLQAQINPHFLYNCLECMRGMMAEKHTDAMEELITHLSCIYRHSAAANAECTLQSELDMVRHYMRILQLRYTPDYVLAADVPEELREWPVLRMIFQPIIENAVRHGMVQANRGKGTVRITAMAREDCLIVTIENDGVSMDDDKLAVYNARFRERDYHGDPISAEHIGILNVHERIRLLYGEQSGLRLENRSEGGIRVTFRIAEK